MSDFFDDSHVTDVGLQGSAGPSVGVWDMVQQGFRQQYRVDSAFALDQELSNRWLESLRAAGISNTPTGASPYIMRDFARFVRDGSVPNQGRLVLSQDPETMGEARLEGLGRPSPEFEEMRRANEAIRQLNNPQIRTFEQILEEVSAMQRGVEEETASMSERSGWGGVVGELLGAIGGSFTLRDPLNVITAPIGAGRTIAMRIATDMAVAGGVTAVTEFGDVAPNRALAGLPERNPLFNIAAATIGAGVIRGGIEGIGYGVRRAREGIAGEEIDFDLRDTQLQQMFGDVADRPTARAAASLLDDTIFIERNNPYGEGQAANVRFLAELQAVQRSMNGEPMTAVARVLPPVPFEYIQKAADFEIVREQAPLVYARMETLQARVRAVEEQVNTASDGTPRLDFKRDNPGGEWLARKIAEAEKDYDPWGKGIKAKGLSGSTTGFGRVDLPVAMLKDLRGVNNEDVRASGKLDDLIGSMLGGYKPDSRIMVWVNHKGEAYLYEGNHRVAAAAEVGIDKIPVEVQWRNGAEDLVGDFSPNALRQFGEVTVDRDGLVKLRAERRSANREYQTAYRAVEAEATRLHEKQRLAETAQQRESSNILAAVSEGRPFVGPLLRYDNVESLVDRINKFNDTLDETAVAAFVRQAEGEAPVREAWLTEDGRIDIGLREPVNPDFRFAADDGEMSIGDAMRDLQDDVDLVDAIRSCAV